MRNPVYTIILTGHKIVSKLSTMINLVVGWFSQGLNGYDKVMRIINLFIMWLVGKTGFAEIT